MPQTREELDALIDAAVAKALAVRAPRVWLRISDLTERFGVVGRTIDRWMENDKFPVPQWNGGVRTWDLASVEEWERARKRCA